MSIPTVYMVDSIEAPSITGNPIPQAVLKAPAIAAYIAGNSWPTWGPYCAARPDLVKSGHIKSISLTANAKAHILDIEKGGATISEAPGWFKNHADKSQGLPWVYTFASQVQALIGTMSSAGIPRSAYYVWSAHANGVPHVCGPRTCGYPQADAGQYDFHVPENCDGSLVYAYVFGPAVVDWQPKDEKHWCAAWDAGHMSAARRARLRAAMTVRAGVIYALVHAPGSKGWNYRHRGRRFQALWGRLHPKPQPK